MISLGLDNALQTTGYSVYNDDKLIAYDTFTIPAYKSIEIRLGEIWTHLNNLYQKYEFEHIFFEDIQQQKGNVQTFKKLAYVQAAILLWCYFNDIKYDILSPSHWRSILKDNYKISFGRSRKEQKQKAQELVRQLYQIEVTEDEADAICLAAAALKEKNNNKSAF